MRVEVSQVLTSGGIKVRADSNSGFGAVRKGELIRAELVSKNDNGVITLKTENGHTFSAKLGAEMMNLAVGDILVLEVLERDNDRISLAFRETGNSEDDVSVSEKNITRDFTDKSLQPYANKLSELGMQVNEQVASKMRDVMVSNPKLSMEEAAFLVSNKLTEDPNIMNAAIRLLAQGERTDALIAKLILMIEDSGAAGQGIAQNLQKLDSLTNLLATLIKNGDSLVDSLSYTKLTNSGSSQAIITQVEGNMQTNVVNLSEKMSQGSDSNFAALREETEITAQKQIQAEVKPLNPSDIVPGKTLGFIGGKPETATKQSLTMPLETTNSESYINKNFINSLQINNGEVNTIKSTQEAFANINLQAQAPLEESIVQTQQHSTENGLNQPLDSNSQNTAQPQPLTSIVAQLLSQIPEFRGTPQAALERFSEMLLRIAGDTVGSTAGETLEAQIEKLFTKITLSEQNLGTQVKEAREELFARLAILEEAVANAQTSSRSELLTQTHRLMDHVRTLNSIEQFVYMQMPVSLNEQRKSAELYIFMRKGGRRADPDNVNILMAIDLEFMGHWEALLNIKGKDVTVNMEVQGEAEKEHFSQNTVLLHKLLDEEGFKLVGTNIKLSEEKVTPITAIDTFDRFLGKRQKGIDIRW